MVEYITKDEAISAIHDGFWTDIRLDKKINDIPAADVEPVVRATWVECQDLLVEPTRKYYECSNCGREEQTKYDRCRCGAHMERSDSGE